ncbi:hypothetical protein FB446DRAFT_703837 [Lentinula raphanica]|nr:hypothetical protein FB446DRAFT_703837 [Lentinula raphanica]
MQTLQAAVNRLPVEILTEVFRFYRAESLYDVTLGIPRQRLCTEMHAITRTCRKWREIVLSNPGFWTSFFLNLEDIESSEQARYLSDALSLSGNEKLRLHIVFNSTVITDLFSSPLITTRFAILMKIWRQADRWQDVRLDLEERLFYGVFLTLNLRLDHLKPPGGHFPNLERLECGTDRLEDEDDERRRNPNSPDRVSFRVFNPCPALHDLSVYDALDVVSIGYPRSLTRLELLRFEGSSLSTLLSRLPNLQTLSLSDSLLILDGEPGYEHPGPWSKRNPLYHQSITTLCLPIYGESFKLHAPWADLRFPSLHTLEIGEVIEDDFEGDLIQPVLDLLIKSECTLQTMVLGKLPLEMFRRLVSVVPLLKNLKLREYHVGGVLLDDPGHFLAPLCGTAAGYPVPSLSWLEVRMHADVLTRRQRNRFQSVQEDEDEDAMVEDSRRHSGNMGEDDTYGAVGEETSSLVATVVDCFRRMISSRLGPDRGPPSVRFKTKLAISGSPPFNPNVDPIAQLPEYLLAVSNMDEREYRIVTVELSWN